MKPTNRLRFIESHCYTKNGEVFYQPYKEKILQQWWAPFNTQYDGSYDSYEMELPGGEWRDVPIEVEE
jgi:hypothetical protein